MFTIRANYSEAIEVNSGEERVHEFFSEINNFIDLMPNIVNIHQDSKGVIHWKIRADIPLIGSFAEKFSVVETENNEDRIEWTPVKGEKYNFMRYSADFMPKSEDKTLIRFSQNVELRRNSAKDLHLLAGLVGENLISAEMSRRVGEMLKIFIEKVKKKIESRKNL